MQDYQKECKPGAATAAIRKRVLAASRGDWDTVVTECLDDLGRLEGSVVRPTPDGKRGVSVHELDARTLEAAAQKARVGGVRGAADLLIGGPPVPPGPDTDEQILKLYRCEPRTADEQGAL